MGKTVNPLNQGQNSPSVVRKTVNLPTQGQKSPNVLHKTMNLLIQGQTSPSIVGKTENLPTQGQKTPSMVGKSLPPIHNNPSQTPSPSQKIPRSSKKRNISETSESFDEKKDEPITNLVASATHDLASIQDMQTDCAYYVR
ncbi:hypothetical protein QYM36_014511 [Artemia franciscana]|uniref:Uncharacterized protein n=1 Tax=Artemia franciscana TaxID=6661 RepID=A0AA88HGT1_ARTSF|nr:hypothetical protein QYM36_014511 [Artemia franciscana]